MGKLFRMASVITHSIVRPFDYSLCDKPLMMLLNTDFPLPSSLVPLSTQQTQLDRTFNASQRTSQHSLSSNNLLHFTVGVSKESHDFQGLFPIIPSHKESEKGNYKTRYFFIE